MHALERMRSPIGAADLFRCHRYPNDRFNGNGFTGELTEPVPFDLDTDRRAATHTERDAATAALSAHPNVTDASSPVFEGEGIIEGAATSSGGGGDAPARTKPKYADVLDDLGPKPLAYYHYVGN